MVLLTTDDLRNIFTKEDFSNIKTYSDYEITTIKKGNLVTYSIKYHNPADAFEKYVKSLDDDIFVKACEMYEKLTGQSLNNLDKLIKSNKLSGYTVQSKFRQNPNSILNDSAVSKYTINELISETIKMPDRFYTYASFSDLFVR